MKYYSIIVAGGTGSRMKSKLPKQFIEVCGKPILIHTIEAFERAFEQIEIIVVMNSDFIDHWQSIAQKHSKQNIQVVAGGKTRFHSVKNGLSKIQGSASIIGVHDSVRPCISINLLQKLYKVAESNDAVIPLIPLKDSIRKIDTQKNESKTFSVNRADYLLVQTPQCFEQKILIDAYEQSYSDQFTDDASVVEADGKIISHIIGEYRNIKITTPSDLQLAELYLCK